MLLVSVAILFVAPVAAVALAAVLCATYACLGRPERAWVPSRVLAAYAQLADPQQDRAYATPVGAGRAAAAPTAPPRESVPLTGPQILTWIDAQVHESGSKVPAEAAATLKRIRFVAGAALPVDDRPLDFTDHETWLVRQAACDYLPSAISRYLAVNPAVRGRIGADGRSPGDVLVDSLREIEGYLGAAVVRANDRDAMAQLDYERFLKDRLARGSALRIEHEQRHGDPEASRARERV